MTDQELRKVTVLLPRGLVDKATEATGKGLTPTLRIGLERIAAAHAFEEVRNMRGKVRIPLDIDKLREDRD